MRKIKYLTVPFGLMAILFIFVFASARASDAKSGSPVTLGSNSTGEQSGTPWYNEAWHYRRPVIITNDGATLSYYQVLIKFDNVNFDFNRAKTDGSDVRFTHSDGTTDLKFWIESWDKANELAYVWVRVPNLGTDNTTIYLYYNNPQATPVSDGAATFDSFDDNWSEFTGEGYFLLPNGLQDRSSSEQVNSPFAWTILSGSPVAISGILNLEDGEGVKSNSSYLYNAVGMRANFGSGNGYEWGGFINEPGDQRTMIGELPTDSDNLYLSDYRTDFENVLLPRVSDDWHDGFHIYEVRWNAGQSIGDIDHGNMTVFSTQPSQVPNTDLPVTLYSYAGSNATLKVDWIYVRQYRDPEPTFHTGAEQGLVELRISNIDSPDPLKPGTTLTYQLTITNSSTIDAPEVVVTDTLPLSVEHGPISSSQGICAPGNVIVCDLNIIPADSIATITVIVTPTVDGEISNNAVVRSPGFELDFSDNTSKQTTFVDSTPPVVIWERPVHNGELYFAFGTQVTLEASATDNSGQVAWVEFRLWDHIGLKWVTIGNDPSYPYQVPFDSSILVPNQIYQMYAVVVDRAGNVSDPYNPLQRIFIGRRLPVFLPLLRR